MTQYLAIKNKHQDAILFFRMGDFYEMFYEDAKTGSEVLGITLTSRAHGKAADVPLAGFPYHALDTYLSKMIKAGYRVAICEQVEDPKFAKTIVKREVLEVVTPGTTVVDDLLETNRNNYLLSLYLDGATCGVAVIDVSTGEFQVREVTTENIADQVALVEPAEILLSETQAEQVIGRLRGRALPTCTRREDWSFHYDYAYETLTTHFGTTSLKGFGIEDHRVGVCAAGAVLAYVRETQKQKLVHINRLSRWSDDDHMLIDASSRRNLELLLSMNQARRHGTLISILDQTRTPMGGRKLVQWMVQPLSSVAEIERRLDAVAELVKENDRRRSLTDILRGTGDVERMLAKFAAGRANAREANSVLFSLKIIDQIKRLLGGSHAALLTECLEGLDPLPVLADEIGRAVVDDPPLAITDGGFIRRGYDEELDRLREIAYSGKDWIARLQQQEREKVGIPSLKVNYNKVFGYYIEITKPHLAKVPAHYIRKQTLVNAERFITQDLKEYEEKVLGAEEKIVTLEYELFNKLRTFVLGFTAPLQRNASLLATLDCLNSLAQVAVDHHYARPRVNEGDELDIREGRHPVIERLLPPGEAFVANDTRIDTHSDQLLIITGPNMAGKSTYLRQVGLIVIMAQMGSFVPAREATIGLVDRLFTRVGASDNLAAGESTFLTEMNETANILNNATAKSLILLDEIGRGTSTFDGLSIAWSVAEYLHNTPRLAAKTIFATHFHELTELELVLPRVKNYNVAVKEWGDHIVFLRKIVRGGCDHSYGIHVAQLAGLPKEVISRAREVLQNLEAEELNAADIPKLAQKHPAKTEEDRQMSLFHEMEKSLRLELQKIDPDRLTPIEALNKLDALKQLITRQEK